MSNGKASTKARKPRKKPAAKPKVEAAPVAEETEAPQPNYLTQKWHAADMYQCTRCPWSTLNKDEMIHHVAKHLSAPAPPQVVRTDTGLVTQAGKQIIREEIVEEIVEE